MLRRCAELLLLAGLVVGCAGTRWNLPRDRPPTTPGPRDVQAEIRDARFFLAYPDQTVGPQAEMQPRQSRRPISSE